MTRFPAAGLAALLALAPVGHLCAERLLSQLTVAREADTGVLGMNQFLVPDRSDSVIFDTRDDQLVPFGGREGALVNLYRAEPGGAMSPIRLASGAEVPASLRGADPTGRWLVVDSACRLDRPVVDQCASAPAENIAMYLVDSLSGTATLVTHRPDRPDEIVPDYHLSRFSPVRVSTDGRFVHYGYDGQSLVDGIQNPIRAYLVYRFDRQSRTNRRIGRPSDPAWDISDSRLVFASDDGSLVLVGMGNGIVRFDATTGTDTQVVTRPGDWRDVRPSRNGAFLVQCGRFVDETDPSAVTVHYQFSRVSVADGNVMTVDPAPQGMVFTGSSCHQHVSDDGNIIVGSAWFPSAGSRSGIEQVVRWNVADNRRSLLTPRAGTADVPSDDFAIATDLSADGAVVLIQSHARDLLAGTTGNHQGALYLYRAGSGLRLVSRDPAVPGRALAASGRMTGSGGWIHFQSVDAPASVRDDNLASDLFAYRVADESVLLTTRRKSELAQAPNGFSSKGLVSADGRWVAYETSASNLLDNGNVPTGSRQVMLARSDGSETLLVSSVPGNPSLGATGESHLVGMSSDGRFVAFRTTAAAIGTSGQPATAINKGIDPPEETFVWDRETRSATRVTRDLAEPNTFGAEGFSLALDGSGQAVLHETTVPESLLPGYVRPAPASDPFANVLLRLPLAAGQAVALVAHAHGQPNTGPDASLRHLGHSPDLQQVAFSTRASNLMPVPVASPLDQIYIADRARDRIHWVTRSAVSANSPSDIAADRSPVAISRDGRFAVFSHAANDLVAPPETGPRTLDCYRISLESGQVVRVSERAAGSAHQAACTGLSDDGRFVLYTRFAGSSSVPPLPAEVWRADMVAGTHALVSPPRADDSDFTAAFAEALSADGAQVLFRMQATTAFPTPPGFFGEDLFLRHMDTGKLELVTNGDAPGIDRASAYLLSISATPDFGTIVFADESRTLKPRIVGGPSGNVFVSRAARISDNPGISGLWGEPGVEGQGFHLVGIPGERRVLLSWYTYLPEGANATRTNHRWLLGLGDIEDGIARFSVSAADTGVFDAAGANPQVPLGEVIFRLGDCNTAEAEYAVDLGGRRHAGIIPLVRITPDTACTGFAASGDSAITALPRPANSRWQYGMGGAWHDATRPGQGMILEVLPAAQQVIATWFTFDAGQVSGDGRSPPLWLAAIGPINGNRARLAIHESVGGRLDRPGGTTLTPIGTLELEAISCTQAVATYTLDLGGTPRTGQIPLDRITSSGACLPP